MRFAIARVPMVNLVPSKSLAQLLALVLSFVVLGVALRLFMERPAESQLRPGEALAIAKLRDPLPANAFLACPPGYCAAAHAAASPVFAVGVDRLYHNFARMVAHQPRVVTVIDQSPSRLAAIQRSTLFGFPDIVIAEFVVLGQQHSSLALYSRARYGRYDFGVNRRRVERWLQLLGQYSPPVPEPGPRAHAGDG